jgi:hypothetical protein
MVLFGLLGWALVGLFVQAVQRSVLQGRERQQAQALQHEAHWRCSALRARAARLQCQALVAERPPADSTALQALVAEAAAPR